MLNKVWVFKFRESGDEDDVVVFDSKPSREQMDQVLLEYLDQLFIDNGTTPAQERARGNDDDFEDLYYEDLWEREFLDYHLVEASRKKEHLQQKLAELYEIAEKIDPDTASVISMAEETLRRGQ
tara:strand:- start:10 stop:381 length:372 start_codon:yes stop_codon:yes gene_type:complete